MVKGTLGLLTEGCHCVVSVFRGMTSSGNGSSTHVEPRSTGSALDLLPVAVWWPTWVTYRTALQNVRGAGKGASMSRVSEPADHSHPQDASPSSLTGSDTEEGSSPACWPLLNLRGGGYSRITVTAHCKVIS